MRWFTTPPLNIVDAPANHKHYSVALPLIPRRIVLHATDGTNSLAWLTTDSVPPVSIHRLIDRGGTIFKCVENHAVAFHVGYASLFPYPNGGLMNANLTSLGIELENAYVKNEDYPQAQLESAINQILEWYGEYGYLPIVGHADLDGRKRDPWRFDWQTFMGELWQRVARLRNGISS